MVLQCGQHIRWNLFKCVECKLNVVVIQKSTGNHSKARLRAMLLHLFQIGCINNRQIRFNALKLIRKLKMMTNQMIWIRSGEIVVLTLSTIFSKISTFSARSLSTFFKYKCLIGESSCPLNVNCVKFCNFLKRKMNEFFRL